MREIRAMSNRGLVALICSLLMVFQPLFAAADPSLIAGVNSATTFAPPVLSHEGPSKAPESIAVAKLTGSADRNGQPLLNGSIVSSGDFLSTHGDSALLLTATPQERLWLGPNTSAKLTKEAGNVAVALARGTLAFRTQGHIQVTFENHDGLAIRSRPDSPALAQLSLVDNQEAQVRLQEGSLELVQGSHSVLLQPEKSDSISPSGTHLAGEPPTKQNAGAQAASASQSGTGSIIGTVVNKELFAVPDANITLTDAAGKILTTLSNHQGKFSFTNLPAGNYTLGVTRTGFQSSELRDVLVRAGKPSSLYVQMVGGGTVAAASSNHLLLWVLIGGAAAGGGIGAYLGTRKSSTPSTSSTQ
jgi:hypothetical protein